MGEMLLPILVAIIPVTVLVMVSAGKTTQALTEMCIRDSFMTYSYGIISLCPAYAGVIPLSVPLSFRLASFPRIRGGDPVSYTHLDVYKRQV